jgi:tetratricopeptide (TPR) repeat protein
MGASSEFKKKVGALVRARLELDRSMIDSKLPGYTRNWVGRYMKVSLFEELCEIYAACIRLAPDENEAGALRYAYAAMLRDGLRLDEAASLCEISIEMRPDRAYGDQSLLAYVEARRGNLDRAKELARIVNSNPLARHFRVHEVDLEREFDAGQVGG